MNQVADYDPKLREGLELLMKNFPNDAILVVRVTDDGEIKTDMFGCPACMVPVLFTLMQLYLQQPHSEKQKMH